MEARKQLKIWYVWVGVVCLACLSIAFGWRSPALILVCISPCLGVICLIAMVIYLLKVKFHWKHAIFGFLAMTASFLVGMNGDSFARETIFRWNLRGYRHTVSEMLKNPPKENGSVPQKLLSGFGIHSADYERKGSAVRIEFETMSGPTLETSVFSTHPLPNSDRLYDLKVKDDLGYWYFMNRS